MWLGICILSSLRNNNLTRTVVPILHLDQRREARPATGQHHLLAIPLTPVPITAPWLSSMNDTAQILDVSAISRTLSEQFAYISSNPPKAGSLIYLLPPCLVLIAIDVAARLSQRPKVALEAPRPAGRDEEVQELVGRVRDALAKYHALEKKLSGEKARSQHLARMLRKQQNFTLHRQRLAALQCLAEQCSTPKPRPAKLLPSHKTTEIRDPFRAFCERLLLQNRIWAQQREVKRLRYSLDSIKHASRANAFQTFCDRLLLSNKIWAQQKAVDHLVGEAEVLKRSRGFVVARAAEKMALDVEKERLTEEFVKGLIAEVEECRQALVSLRSEHELEVQQLAQDWREDCRRLAKEVERLELSREAHLVEQGLSNEQEQELLEHLYLIESRTAALNAIDEEPMGYFGENHMDDASTCSGSDFERMSTMSNTTCVTSAGIRTPNRKPSFGETPPRSRRHSYNMQFPVPLPPLKTIPRRPSMSIILSPSAGSSSPGSPVRRLEAGPYAGFSFNPLFFGNTSNSHSGERSDSPARVRTYSLQSPIQYDRMRTYSLQSDRRGSGSYSSLSNVSREQPKRAMWRL